MMLAPFAGDNGDKTPSGHSGGSMGMMGDGSMMPMMGHGGMMSMDHSNNGMDDTSVEHNDASRSKSYVITQRYCTQCHELKPPSLHTPSQWQETIGRMQGYMKDQDRLQPDVYELIMIEHYYGIDMDAHR